MRKMSGMTLVEMMITVAVLAILLGIATPNFVDLINRNKVSAMANDLLASMLIARSEAVKRGAAIEIVRLGGNWANGWVVRVDAGNTELTRHVIDNGVVVANNGNLNTVRYLPSGRTAAVYSSGDYFDLGLDGNERVVCFSITGRPSVVVGDTCP